MTVQNVTCFLKYSNMQWFIRFSFSCSFSYFSSNLYLEIVLVAFLRWLDYLDYWQAIHVSQQTMRIWQRGSIRTQRNVNSTFIHFIYCQESHLFLLFQVCRIHNSSVPVIYTYCIWHMHAYFFSYATCESRSAVLKSRVCSLYKNKTYVWLSMNGDKHAWVLFTSCKEKFYFLVFVELTHAAFWHVPSPPTYTDQCSGFSVISLYLELPPLSQ